MLLVEDPVFSGDKWRHTGFNIFFGPRILPWQENPGPTGRRAGLTGRLPARRAE